MQLFPPVTIVAPFVALLSGAASAVLKDRAQNAFRMGRLQVRSHCSNTRQVGFTLIELAIVLVIIGLIVGGVLVGRNLIGASTVRAQVTQIEKFNAAVNTFYGKYGYLPGDMPPTVATQFGFYVGVFCTPDHYGSRNGDGFLQRMSIPYSLPNDYEPAVFWEDLSSPAAGNLIEGNFGLYPHNVECSGNAAPMSMNTLSAIMPPAKIGNGNYLYVYTKDAANWFGLSSPNSSSGSMLSYPGLTVNQARSIDAKIDDGIPTSGNVVAVYLNWSDAYNTAAAPNGASDDATTCYNSTTSTYSLSVSAGSNVNCGLSFKMQGGD